MSRTIGFTLAMQLHCRNAELIIFRSYFRFVRTAVCESGIEG